MDGGGEGRHLCILWPTVSGAAKEEGRRGTGDFTEEAEDQR